MDVDIHPGPVSAFDGRAFDQAVYFDEDLVRQTEVIVRPGSLSFAGEFLVQTALLREADPVQTHGRRKF
jgi:hypothetical protein